MSLGSRISPISGAPSLVAGKKKASLTASAGFVFPLDQPDNYNFMITTKEFTHTREGTNRNTMNTYVLPVPSAINDVLGMTYSETSMGAIGGEVAKMVSDYAAKVEGGTAKGAGKQLIESLKGGFDSAKKNVEGMKTSDKLAALNAAFGEALGERVGGAAGAVLGSVPNPHKTTFFKGVNLKNYSFSWNLFPASAAEGRVLTDMINNLRIDSLPKRALKGLALTYPYEFHLRINTKGGNHTQVFKPAFCTNLAVNYTPFGPAFMEDGKPAGVTLNMNFQEIDVWTREDYDGTPVEGVESSQFRGQTKGASVTDGGPF